MDTILYNLLIKRERSFDICIFDHVLKNREGSRTHWAFPLPLFSIMCFFIIILSWRKIVFPRFHIMKQKVTEVKHFDWNFADEFHISRDFFCCCLMNEQAFKSSSLVPSKIWFNDLNSSLTNQSWHIKQI